MFGNIKTKKIFFIIITTVFLFTFFVVPVSASFSVNAGIESLYASLLKNLADYLRVSIAAIIQNNITAPQNNIPAPAPQNNVPAPQNKNITAPLNFYSASFSPDQIELRWDDNSKDAESYIIERSQDGVNFTEIAQVQGSQSSYKDNKKLDAGSVYHYRIKKNTNSGSSNYSEATISTPSSTDASNIKERLTEWKKTNDAFITIIKKITTEKVTELSKTYNFSKPVVSKSKTGRDIIKVAGNQLSSLDLNKPVMPFKPVSILVPSGFDVAGVEIIPGDPILFSGSYSIEPSPAISPTSGKFVDSVGDKRIYNSDNIYPFEPVGDITIQNFKGFKIAVTTIYPLEYHPASKKVYYYPNIQVKLKLVPAITVAGQESLSPSTFTKDRSNVATLVDNPETVYTYIPPAKELKLPEYETPIGGDSPMFYEYETYETLANGMPILNSRPGAAAAIFIDFDGDASTSTTPYSEDGDSTTFTATEAAHIAECWRQVSAYYAMFDVNVTTIQPDTTKIPTAWGAIGNNISGGYAVVNSFPNPNRPYSFNQSSDARGRISGIAHEIGHNFGLDHQSTYDLSGNRTTEYSSGYDTLHGPLMGVDYAGIIHKWYIGRPSWSPASFQYDMSVIVPQIRNFAQAWNGYTGDGYAPDDFADTIAKATPLSVSGGTQAVAGVIEKLTDADAFSFTIKDQGNYLLSVTPVSPSGLDPTLSIYDSEEKLLGYKDGDPLIRAKDINVGTLKNIKKISLTLQPGTYYAVVASHGNYGDIGQYAMAVVSSSDASYISDTVTRAGAVSNFTVSSWVKSNSTLILNWIDSSWETGYRVERSLNGVDNWTILSTETSNTPSNRPGYTDRELALGNYYYRVVTVDASGDSATSSVVLASTKNLAPRIDITARAEPNPVTGNSTGLYASATDDDDELNLTYTWATTKKPSGAAEPIYSSNGTSASRSVSATFSSAGVYTFKVTIADTGGLTVTSSTSVTVNQTLTSAVVAPATVSLNINQTQQFSATALDQFGNAMASQPSFTWSKTSGVGIINSTGMYTAPAVAGSSVITATSGSLSKNATIEVKKELGGTKAITAFDFAGLTPLVTGSINETAHTISLTVPYGTNVTALVPTIIITGASVSPASGAAQNFTSSVVYTVTAENSSTQNYTVSVNVSPQITYTITSSSGTGGSISPSGAATVNQGFNQTFTITPSSHYHVSNVLVDGVSVGTVGSYTFTNVTANHTISSTFAANTYTLTYTAGTHGSVSGTSPQTVNYGVSGTAVTAVPATGYHFVSWSDSSTSNPRTDTSVVANISVTASFAINTYTLVITSKNGTVTKSPDKVSYNHNETVVLAATPNAGYSFTSWSDGATGSTNPLTITMDSDKSITASFTIIPSKNKSPAVNAGKDQTITLPTNQVSLDATATDDGLPDNKLVTIWTKVSGPGTVTFSDSSAVDATATFSEAGIYILNLEASDGELSASDTVTITVEAAVIVIPVKYTITASEDPHSSITPKGDVLVESGASQTFTIEPKNGYSIKDVIVDEVSKGALTSFQFQNVTVNHIISIVSFACDKDISDPAKFKPIVTGLDTKTVTDPRAVPDFFIGKPDIAKILFKSPVDLLRVDSNGCYSHIDINTSVVVIQNNSIKISSVDIPELNQPAELTFYNVNYTNPVIKRDGVICQECLISNYDKTTHALLVSVPGFSEYTIEEGLVCSNSIIESPEQCDDGNANNGDGCNSTCQTETSYTCTGQPSVCTKPNTGGSGGGGGVIITDVTAPASPSEFTAVKSEAQGQSSINLTWTNPVGYSDFSGVLMIKKQDSAPTSKTDGIVVYQGTLNHFADTNNINPLATYYYSIYSFDYSNNYSLAKTISVSKDGVNGVPIEEQMTKDQVQAKIAELIAEITRLQALIAEITGQSPITTRMPSGFRFNSTLMLGTNSDDVQKLQIFLNLDPDTQIAKTGYGSPGNETIHFGQATLQAVIKFQQKYVNDISEGKQLTSGAGVVGPKTREKINGLLIGR